MRVVAGCSYIKANVVCFGPNFRDMVVQSGSDPRTTGLGLARSFAEQGLTDQAREQYQKLTQILINEQLPGYQEAKSYLAAGGD